MDNFVMKSENSTAQIKCTNNSSIHFNQSQHVHITNLEFIGCGGNQVRHVEEFVVQDTTFKGQDNSGTALELIETTTQIVNSTFVLNKRGLYRETVIIQIVKYVGIDFIGSGRRSIRSSVGGAIIATKSTVNIINKSTFEDNSANIGGAIFAENSIINLSGNVFVNNNADLYGGVLHSYSSIITIKGSDFQDNSVGFDLDGYIIRGGSGSGGVLYSSDNTITREASKFHDNSAYLRGGVLYSHSSNITIETSEFYDNSATSQGGVLYSDKTNYTPGIDTISSIITIGGGGNFTKNTSPIGAVIYATDRSKIQHDHGHLLINNNIAKRYAVMYLVDSEFIGHYSDNVITFSNNLGSLVAFNSNITFIGNATLIL